MGRQFTSTHYPTAHTRLIIIPAQFNCAGFFDDACYKFYMDRLCNSLWFYQVQLHGYALLPDRIWLLVTPKTLSGIGSLVSAVNGEYSDYFNTRFSRNLCVWSNNYGEFSVISDKLVLACQKFIEREPLRRKLSEHIGVWPWTSYVRNAFGGMSEYLTRHPAVSRFLQSDCDPGKRYRDYVAVDFDGEIYEQTNNGVDPLPLLVAANPLRESSNIVPLHMNNHEV